jgi:hypothetical protein
MFLSIFLDMSSIILQSTTIVSVGDNNPLKTLSIIYKLNYSIFFFSFTKLNIVKF